MNDELFIPAYGKPLDFLPEVAFSGLIPTQTFLETGNHDHGTCDDRRRCRFFCLAIR